MTRRLPSWYFALAMLWLALAGALAAPLLLRWNRASGDRERQGLERLRLARLDLSLGLMHATLAGDPDLPWSQAEGLALMAQAVDSLEEADRTHDLHPQLARFREVFARARTEHPPAAATQTQLRLAAAELDEGAAHADLELRRTLEDSRAARLHAFELVLWGVVTLFGLAGLGFVFAARSQATIELRLRQLADAFPGLFWLQRTDGTVLYVTGGRAGLLGYAQAPDGSPLTWRAHLHPDDAAALAGSPRAGLDLELRVHGAGQAFHRVRLRTRAVRGEPTLLAGLVEDRTHERALEAALGQAEKLEVLGRMAGGLVHDLNNLLMVFGGALDALGVDDAGERAAMQAEGRAALEHVAELLRQLLAFSRRRPPDRVPVDLNELARQTCQVARRLLGPTIELELDLPAGPLTVVGEQAMLEQALMNLLINARDAMPRGGRLVVRTRQVGDAVHLDVQDTGTGISPDVLPHVFEPFFTTKPEGQGTGIGLATVDRVVQQHQGTLAIESKVGEGTTFHLSFPTPVPAPAPREGNTP